MQYTNRHVARLVKYVNDNPSIPFEFKYEKKIELPKDRKLVMISNHSGWLAFDAMVAGNFILPDLVETFKYATGKKDGEFMPSEAFAVVVHEVLDMPPFKYMFPKNLIKENFIVRNEYSRALKEGDMDAMPRNLAIFPEDERGSTKSFLQAYTLRKFKTGFLRHALETDSDILINTIVGCEELFPSLCQVNIASNSVRPDLTFPIPLLPLFLNPVTMSLLKESFYKLTVHEVIPVSDIREMIESGKTLDDCAEHIRNIMQVHLDREVHHRPLKLLSKLVNKKMKESGFLDSIWDFNINIKF